MPFTQGLDLKTDPFQVDAGKFLALSNSVFTQAGLLEKRNGFPLLTSIPSGTNTDLTAYNGDLTVIGNKIWGFSAASNTWQNHGFFQPCSLSTLPAIRNTYNQTQVDVAIALNGTICTVYSELESGTTVYKFAIVDGTTGQNLLAPSTIIPTAGAVTGPPRVFALGQFFIIVFPATISSVAHLEYVAISSSSFTVNAALSISSAFTPGTSGQAFDGLIYSNTLFLFWNGSDSGGAIRGITLSPTLVLSTVAVFATLKATLISVCVDETSNVPTIFVSLYNASTSLTYAMAVNTALNVIAWGTQILASGTFENLASTAQNGVLTIFYEVANTYGYGTSQPSNYIESVTLSFTNPTYSVFSNGSDSITVSSATGLVTGQTIVDNTTPANIFAPTTITVSGTTLTLSANTEGNSASSPGDALVAANIGSPAVVIRSVGLASKAILYNGVSYFLVTYSSPYQPTYFLVTGSGQIVAKLAYENGGGYLTTGLCNLTNNNALLTVGYLYKDLIEAVNNTQGAAVTTGVYTQTGINVATINLNPASTPAIQTAQTLHLGGGFLWQYDGNTPVEHNFFLWPDNVVAATQADPTPTGTVSNVTNPTIMTSVSSVAGLAIGMGISGSGIPSNTTIVAIGTTTVTMSKSATGAHSAATYTFTGQQAAQQYYYQVTYEWQDYQGNLHRSAPSIPVTATTTSGNSSVVIDIPSLRLTYKTSTPVSIVIYRWSVAQQTYFQITSITLALLNPNILTTDSVAYIDAQSDAQIDGNNILYTTGGVVENVNAPSSSVMTLFDSRLWLLDAEDPNLWWYSKQVIEATPVEMSDLFTYYVDPNLAPQGNTGPITAGATMDQNLISFKKDAIFYTNGTGPDNTGANSQYSQPIFITSTVGCENQNSIVFIPQGLMFQSDKGIWLLGRDLSTSFIGSPVNAYNNATALSAVNVPATNQVRFTLDNGVTLQYDYFYQQWATFNGIPGTSSTIYNSAHTYLFNNNIYQESEGTYLDNSNPVLMNFTTAWFKLANLQGYQRAYYVYLLGLFMSPHKLLVTIAYDYNPSPTQTVLISPSNWGPNWGNDTNWGSSNAWGGSSNIEQWKINLARQKCEAFQVTVQEIYDPTYGVPPGAGFTLSGLNLVIGVKKGYRPIRATLTAT